MKREPESFARGPVLTDARQRDADVEDGADADADVAHGVDAPT